MKAINYGWVIVGVGLLVKMTGLGFGRFAYPMLIPSMKGSLGFNYAEIEVYSGLDRDIKSVQYSVSMVGRFT